MSKSNKFSPEVRERAGEDGAGAPGSTRRCGRPSVHRAQDRLRAADAERMGSSVLRSMPACAGRDDQRAQRVKDLEREVRELRKANEILKLASAFSPRRSSTAASSPEGLLRPASPAVWGRVDLPRHADRPSAYWRHAARRTTHCARVARSAMTPVPERSSACGRPTCRSMAPTRSGASSTAGRGGGAAPSNG